MKNMTTAWHGDAGVKADALKAVQTDSLLQGQYLDEEGRGCVLGLLTLVGQDDDPQAEAERLFGLEERIGCWLEKIFEELPSDEAADWAIAALESIPVGGDLSMCHHQLWLWLAEQSGLLSIDDSNRNAIEAVTACHRLALAGGEPDWVAAREAAWAVELDDDATEPTWSAAQSAAWSASDDARSVAESTWWVAQSSPDSRGIWQEIAAITIMIFRAS